MKILSYLINICFIFCVSTVFSDEVSEDVKKQISALFEAPENELIIIPSELASFYIVNGVKYKLTEGKKYYFSPNLRTIISAEKLYKIGGTGLIPSMYAEIQNNKKKGADRRKLLFQNIEKMQPIKVKGQNPFNFGVAFNLFVGDSMVLEMHTVEFIRELTSRYDVNIFPSKATNAPEEWCMDKQHALEIIGVSVNRTDCVNKINMYGLLTKVRELGVSGDEPTILLSDGRIEVIGNNPILQAIELMEKLNKGALEATKSRSHKKEPNSNLWQDELKNNLIEFGIFQVSKQASKQDALKNIKIGIADKESNIYWVTTGDWSIPYLYFKNENYITSSSSVMALPKDEDIVFRDLKKNVNHNLFIKYLAPHIAEAFKTPSISSNLVVYNPPLPTDKTAYLFLSWHKDMLDVNNDMYENLTQSKDYSFMANPIKLINGLVEMGFNVKIMSPITQSSNVSLVNYCEENPQIKKQLFETLLLTRNKEVVDKLNECESDFPNNLGAWSNKVHIGDWDVIFENGFRYKGRLEAESINQFYQMHFNQ